MPVFVPVACGRVLGVFLTWEAARAAIDEFNPGLLPSNYEIVETTLR